MYQVVPEAGYTLGASAKKITLISPWDTLEIASIISIKDITTGDQIYDSENIDYQITLSAGVITYTYPNGAQAYTDKLQIIVLTNGIDGGGA